MSNLAEILSQIDMEYALDREGITYKLTYGKSGQQLNVKECPCCGNSKWKVYLNAELGVGNCFVCEQKFTKYRFIEAMTGLSSRDLSIYLKEVALEMGWKPKIKPEEVIVNTNTEVTLPNSRAIPIAGLHNLKYLSKRGIDIETAKYFHLSYCSKGWYRYLWNGEEKYQRYFKRIIIPIFDLDGNLVSFQGRDITGESEKKYLFPPGLASTGKYLYNGHNALRAKRVVITEGAFDTFAVKMAFADELSDVIPIATFGKNLSESEGGQVGEFIKLRRLGLEEATFMWDSESAALKAAIKASKKLEQIGIKTRLAILPVGCDPNEVDASVVRRAFTEAQRLTRSVALRLSMQIQ